MAFLVRVTRRNPGFETRLAQERVGMVWTRVGGCYIGAVTRTGVRFRGVSVTDVYASKGGV